MPHKTIVFIEDEVVWLLLFFFFFLCIEWRMRVAAKLENLMVALTQRCHRDPATLPAPCQSGFPRFSSAFLPLFHRFSTAFPFLCCA